MLAALCSIESRITGIRMTWTWKPDDADNSDIRFDSVKPASTVFCFIIPKKFDNLNPFEILSYSEFTHRIKFLVKHEVIVSKYVNRNKNLLYLRWVLQFCCENAIWCQKTVTAVKYANRDLPSCFLASPTLRAAFVRSSWVTYSLIRSICFRRNAKEIITMYD